MIAFVQTHAPALILATACACGVLIATLLAVVAHLERRLQLVEHEIATMHAHGAPGPQPTAPEVKRRYDEMAAA